jgi:hypothetical protein
VHNAAANAFIHGLSVSCLVAGAIAAAGAVMAAALLPAQPTVPGVEDSPAAPAGERLAKERG